MRELNDIYEDIINDAKFSEIDLEITEIVDWLIDLMNKKHIKTKKDLEQKIMELDGGQLGTTWSKDARVKYQGEMVKRLQKKMKDEKIKLK